MTPKERVMTALRRGQPDMVPWVENDIEEEIQIKVMKGRTDYTPGELCRALGMDGFGYHFPTGGAATAGQSLQSGASMKETYYNPRKITFDFVPPWIAAHWAWTVSVIISRPAVRQRPVNRCSPAPP